MEKYLLKFEKTGTIRYISHLDLMRQFQRAFKRAEIALAYSQGFNPHPKMSFGQPLSLGFTSVGEYLEFETLQNYLPEDIIKMLNETIPNGLKVIDCAYLHGTKKTVAAMVEYGSYEILSEQSLGKGADEVLTPFLAQETILVEKRQKKGKMAEVDIRPMIKALFLIERPDGIAVLATIAAGSNANLNPELLMKALFAFVGKDFENGMASIKRLELFNAEEQPIFEMTKFKEDPEF
ncbi:MAG: TIGR03936 family radical SAM-associated protein [Eubacteriales bacterium]|nr:TIGR03936 family radical SAM-associated protein [Eubacteriales bacterium]MDD3349415.1 TIGR03936 family radical SAM-associated protein [Eubacteriales bacterium]